MLNPKIALIPGSFDPPTIGHYDLVMRAAAIFEEVWVTAFVNSSKQGSFTTDEKRAMLETAFSQIPNVRVDVSEAMLAEYAMEHGIGTIVKGARSGSDFDYELSMSLINRSLASELDTVILPTKAEYMHVSSTMVREMLRYGHDYHELVPSGVADLIADFVNKKC